MGRVLWINGPFGGGKTSAATRLVERNPALHLFDPEWVGMLFRAMLPGVENHDFQDLPGWRRLVPVVAREVSDQMGRPLVAVQTVLNSAYWDELRAGMGAQGLSVTHVVLDVEEQVLRNRIDGDENDKSAAQWRHEHVDEFVAARSWLMKKSDIVVDSTTLTVDEVVDEIVRRGMID